jgi:type IV/VI secretion system ImpK/VasF family protein
LEGRNLGRLAGDVVGYVLLFTEAPDAQRPSLPALRSHLLGLLDTFSKQPDAQALPADEVEEARFALVAFADEMLLRSDWSGREEWLQEPLQLQLFRTNRAGDEFYEHLARLRPDQNHAREVYFLCLVNGFEGQYAGQTAERAQILRQQFEFLRASGHALDAASASPLTPPAYELSIQLRGPAGRRLWPVVLAWAGLVLGIGLTLWIVLQLFAGGVELPPGA